MVMWWHVSRYIFIIFENSISYLLILGTSETDVVLNNKHHSNILPHNHQGNIYVMMFSTGFFLTTRAPRRQFGYDPSKTN
jgi:hypothetical protein